MFNKTFKKTLDLIFPLTCVACQIPGSLVCQRCASSITAEIPQRLTRPTKHLDCLIACGLYKNQILQQAIHGLKYEGVTLLAPTLAGWMHSALAAYVPILKTGTPTIIPIPLHRRRLRARGFNQSELLARELAKIISAPVEAELLRARATPSQTTLRRDERVKNITGAFQYAEHRAPHSVLLIDDVATTLATLEEAARILKKYGARRVTACALAYEDLA